MEGRASPKGNGGQTAAARTLRRDTASNGLAAVRRAARQSKAVRFTALLHNITTDLLKQSYLALTRDAAPGTDGVTWQAYGENLEEKLKDLHERVHRGSYRARPARRTYIPKADGSKRPPQHSVSGGNVAVRENAGVATISLRSPMAGTTAGTTSLPLRKVLVDACGGEGHGRHFVVGRQLWISLSRASEVSNFDQTATKERMILHVRLPERHPHPPDTPCRPVRSLVATNSPEP